VLLYPDIYREKALVATGYLLLVIGISQLSTKKSIPFNWGLFFFNNEEKG
jgi:hypothetical protein